MQPMAAPLSPSSMVGATHSLDSDKTLGAGQVLQEVASAPEQVAQLEWHFSQVLVAEAK